MNVDKTLFDIVFNQLLSINVSMKWLNDVDVENYSEPSKQVISFYEMGSFKLDYYRYVEKQLVITEGKQIYLVLLFEHQLHLLLLLLGTLHTLNCIQ